ncbi:MAG: hypothetical protein R2867_01750 [Caldilineaceae bacterium]
MPDRWLFVAVDPKAALLYRVQHEKRSFAGQRDRGRRTAEGIESTGNK